jgi:regulator of protease activity HflC (stomatin/prohibitin superfamily)
MNAHSTDSQGGDGRDPYRPVFLLLAGTSVAGVLLASAGGSVLGSPVLLDIALALGIASGVLIGVVTARSERLAPPAPVAGEATQSPLPPADGLPDEPEPAEGPSPPSRRLSTSALTHVRAWLRVLTSRDVVGGIRIVVATGGGLGVALLLLARAGREPLSAPTAAIAAALCLAAAGLGGVIARYFAALPTAGPLALAEAPGLARGARVLAWLMVLAAAAMVAAWRGRGGMVQAVHLLVLIVVAAFCIGLLGVRRRERPARSGDGQAFPLDAPVLSLLGSRANPVASALDAAQRQLGIDLRSTWALTVVRRTAEPLLVALCLLGWLSTSLTVVRVAEEGLVERLGVPVRGRPLQPGLHVHWPWPIDRVVRLPVRRVQALSVGHEEADEGGEAEEGPEDVVWASQHAVNEYTLLLGDGRDLLTVDAAVQYRIRDARAWRYGCQNPAEALRAIAYRAVMRSTVHRTLADALSENVVTLTQRMREMVQEDADRLGLGVEVVAFTVAGLHPPVAVAADYQAVASAELGKVTAAVDAQAFRHQTLPAAESEVMRKLAAARGEGAETLARAAGQAWSFRALRAEVGAGPGDFAFRRRLEALEKGLAGRRFTVVDARIQRDGGELWLMP